MSDRPKFSVQTPKKGGDKNELEEFFKPTKTAKPKKRSAKPKK